VIWTSWEKTGCGTEAAINNPSNRAGVGETRNNRGMIIGTIPSSEVISSESLVQPDSNDLQ